MPKPIIHVPVVDLLLDEKNARLKSEQPSQPAALLALANHPDADLVNLAEDIVEQGSTDPTALLAVIESPEQPSRYIALEGNRRLAALKGLENPSLLLPALSKAKQKKLRKLSEKFAANPIETLECRPFDTEEEARHWIKLRHTGKNKGRGLVEWGADEKDRYNARHGERSPAGQIVDFVEKYGALSDTAKQAKPRILSNVSRLISTPAVRERLGISIHDGKVLTDYPAHEVATGLTKIAEDLLTKETTVKDIYHAKDRLDYIKNIALSDLPNPKTKLENPRPLSDLEEVANQTSSPKKKKRRFAKNPKPRTTTIPRDLEIHITIPRIELIRKELSSLQVDRFTNACSVLLRVFVELSVDHYLVHHQVMSEESIRSTHLAKRIKAVASHLQAKGQINQSLAKAITKIADSPTLLASSTITMNQYVHNQYVFPKPIDLLLGWDELEPFICQIWPEN